MERMRTAALTADDAALVAAFRAGEPSAFEVIVRRYYPRLMLAAERRCGESALADDAVQAAFIRAHRYLQGRGEIANLGGWLYRVVSNCALDLLAAERKPHAELDLAAGAGARQQGELERHELRALVADGIEKLPEVYREPLTLKDLHGVEAREIAARLGDNLHSVKSRLARGRTELRRRLGPVLTKGGYLEDE